MSSNNSLLIQKNTEKALSDKFMILASENFDTALKSLSRKNRKEYEATLIMWSKFSHEYGLDQRDFTLKQVESFLTDNDWSFNTRKVRLAHLRKFAELLALADVDNQYGFAFNLGRLALLKPKSLGGKKAVLKTIALSHRQVYQVFGALDGDNNKNTRDRALLGLMILGGLRSFEVVALKWEHIDFENKRLLVAEGKGDKPNYVPLLGDLSALLKAWKFKQAISGSYQYICSQIFRSDKIANDKQCTKRVISSLCDFISSATGITIKPHDTRRTAITLMLDDGASVAQVRDFARHESGETTLIYAKKSNATKLGHQLDDIIKFGDVMGGLSSPDDMRHFECSNGHRFLDHFPHNCPECGSTDLIVQQTMFAE